MRRARKAARVNGRSSALNPVMFGVTITCPSWRITSLNTDVAGAAAPDAFGPFRVLHQIGAGALGPVFRAYDPDRDRLAAVKVFRLNLPPDRAHVLADALDRVTAAGVGHPCIAAPVATGISDVSVYLVQEFAAGEGLDAILRSRTVPVPEALRIVTAVAAALDHAAAVDVMHGALHPRDVLVSADEVRLTGLGVVKALERAGAAVPVRRPYAPPERAAGSDWDRRGDVFSLAAIACEMLWGRRLVATGDEAAALLTPLPGVDNAAMQRVFARALAGEPDGRFDTAGEFALALERAGDGHRTADPLPLVRREPRPAGRSVEAPRLPLGNPERAESDESAEESMDGGSGPVVAADMPYTAWRRGGTREVPRPAGSVLLPLAAGAVVFLSIGFAVGYGVGSRQMPESAPDAAVVSAPVPEVPDRPATEIAPAPAVAQQGEMTVTSTPAGARVFVAGVEQGRTPLIMPAVPLGQHAIRVVHEGYLPVERDVALTAASPSQALIIAFQPARPSVPSRVANAAVAVPPPAPAVRSAPAVAPAATGALHVESRPSGATVYVDGRLSGTTPLQLGAVRSGERAVHLELKGYRRWTSAVDVTGGGRHRVAASLEPVSPGAE
jgi:hypothetical protein